VRSPDHETMESWLMQVLIRNGFLCTHGKRINRPF
jgi:hypothetical protein